MCGIIAVARRPSTRPTPEASEILDPLAGLAAELRLGSDPTAALRDAADHLLATDALLRGVPGVRLLTADPTVASRLRHDCGEILEVVEDLETAMERDATLPTVELERRNHELVRVRDGLWAITRDRIRAAEAVAELSDGLTTESALEAYLSVHQALSALDRLEVRGRDSAGIHVLVRRHALDVDDPAVKAEIARRAADESFRSGSARLVDGTLSIVHKTAAEIGELGDNTAVLRAAFAADELLRAALRGDDARTLVLGHTRWASIGIISEPNAHPLNSDLLDFDGPYVVGALNGDVDNFADLIADEAVSIPPSVTTDAKVIPSLMSRRLAEGHDSAEAFRRTVATFEGSVAIGACTAAAPDRLQLALRGSGQALYVGLAEDAFVVASEPYGVVEETARYIRMDGETPGNPENANASRGQIIELDSTAAGSLDGVLRRAYDGTDLPVADHDVVVAQITTRDIDRGDSPHYLLKEIGEAPASFRKTLRGKIAETDDGLAVTLGPEILPPDVVADVQDGTIREVLVIGQGTAAVAARSVAASIAALVPDGRIRSEAVLATELSGFGLRRDMSRTLVVAVSQSGTTTDTNRTVDLVRARGARVIAIVNRRNSDLTDRADGVLYTSDGRDVEMSVASTKAFYSQIAAGFLLAVALADLVRGDDGAADRRGLLASIEALPAAMDQVIQRRATIGAAARQFAPGRRYWALVGNGSNRIAASEVRIKLSELCYKSIACDATEDKKHIDLSTEPMILVCAAGLDGSTADDVAKEVAIFRAHKAAPIVIADDDEQRFDAALAVLPVPPVDPRLGFVLSAMAGHLFGYEAALAIDSQAQPLREARSAIEQAAADGYAGDEALATVRPVLERSATSFFDMTRAGELNGHLEASTAVRIATLLRFALGVSPLETYQIDYGKVGTPAVVLDDLAAALTLGIEELTRPIDAIKHQAKTVTVGISRSDETLLEVPLAAAVLEAGAPRDRLSYASLRTLADLDPAVAEVLGHTRYRVEGMSDDGTGEATVVVVDRGGISLNIPTRTDRTPTLRGTKNQVALERRVFVARGRSDGRSIIIVPELKDNVTTGLTLLQVRFADRLSAAAARGVLQGYRNRYSAVRDAVMETEETFREDLLADQDVGDLLTLPINDLADRWRVDGG
ncbi:MAG: SIS domain-containing protein [Actinobacteria bacterium]|nr:SIS domain-containing protein [Actinomycetota bacterium]NIS32481.1 SIS domain-containing protein [Actinomycetota bacterium]NIT96096.1 SIS domain-containing protein [Actinomycetota bacterium]NIU19979.1 SIS domain-containing protein [Actinomycetota bacterium]NIU67499.1 SIS domain-containing protein [Actinomycetota bacterium]